LIQNGLAEFLPLAVEKKMGACWGVLIPNPGDRPIPGAKPEYAPASAEI
jgi:hypothetical protein